MSVSQVRPSTIILLAALVAGFIQVTADVALAFPEYYECAQECETYYDCAYDCCYENTDLFYDECRWGWGLSEEECLDLAQEYYWDCDNACLSMCPI